MKPDAKLARALEKTALIQYKKWRDVHGEPEPWGAPHALKSKSAHNLLMAAKALYDATEQARVGKGRK